VGFVPASDEEHGRICFGFDFGGEDLAVTGGVNDQGLFIDGNSVAQTGWIPDEEKETFHGNIEAYVLAHHGSVAEVIDWFTQTNVAILSRAKFLMADRSGASAVVEWADGGLQVVRRDGDFQISTNFVQTGRDPAHYPCYRYRTAAAILGDAEECSVDLVRRILAATHFEGSGSQTLFSYIGDLTAGVVYIYNFHNFEDVVRLDLAEELGRTRARESRQLPLPQLFERVPYAQHLCVPTMLSATLQDLSQRKEIGELLEDISESKALCLETFGRDYTESIVNSLGYSFLGEDRVDEAITVLAHNVVEHPESGNVYDSLGEAYMVRGDTLQAITNYRRSLEIDPDNMNAVEMLGRLE
jgi:hypothetical protein